MDGNRFDAWTRRRFGLGAGATLAALFVVRDGDYAGARRRRCKRPGAKCTPGGRRCCRRRQCDQIVVDGAVGTFCCKPEGASCSSNAACCSRRCDRSAGGGTCRPCEGRPCDAKAPCCGGFDCTDGFCGGCVDRGFSCSDTQPCCVGVECSGGFCGGCRGRGTICSSDTECCLNNCTGPGSCLSLQGGPCEEDLDCRSCYEDFGNCPGACANGTCAV